MPERDLPQYASEDPITRIDLFLIYQGAISRWEKSDPITSNTTALLDMAILALQNLRALDSETPQNKKPRKMYLGKNFRGRRVVSW